MAKISSYSTVTPQSGDFLVLARAGKNYKADASTVGVTAYTDLTNKPTPEVNANNIFSVTSPGGTSAFSGTIATLPGGAVLTYNAGFTGTEGSLVPASTSQLAKIILYNTTRGTNALILNCTTGTNTITLTDDVPAGWQVGDTITITSQTVSGDSFPWIDLEITSGPTGKTKMFIILILRSATVGDRMTLHPYETYSSSKNKNVWALAANEFTETMRLMSINSNKFSMFWDGTPAFLFVREEGYLE